VIVLDVSAVIEMLLQTEAGVPVAERVPLKLLAPGASSLLDVEVLLGATLPARDARIQRAAGHSAGSVRSCA